MKGYLPKYVTLLPAGEGDLRLPGSLRILIEKFENAHVATTDTNQESQPALQKILAQVDAVICASIHNVYGTTQAKRYSLPAEPIKVDATTLMAMKAKALRLKWKMKKIQNKAL